MEESGTGRGPCLIVLRGNSASGKSTVAAQIRARYGRGIVIVGLTDRISDYGCPDLRLHVTSMFMT